MDVRWLDGHSLSLWSWSFMVSSPIAVDWVALLSWVWPICLGCCCWSWSDRFRIPSNAQLSSLTSENSPLQPAPAIKPLRCERKKKSHGIAQSQGFATGAADFATNHYFVRVRVQYSPYCLHALQGLKANTATAKFDLVFLKLEKCNKLFIYQK